MAQIHCFTTATLATLDRARVLGLTLRQNEPTWMTWLCLLDVPPPGVDFDPAKEPFDHVIDIFEIGLTNPRFWTFAYEFSELRPIVNGAMLSLLLSSGAEKVVHLDASTAVFSALLPLQSLLERHAVVLSPRMLEATHDPLSRGREIGVLEQGVVDNRFFAVANTHAGRRFAGWLHSRLTDGKPPAGGAVREERWLDLAPALFDAYLLRDPGCTASLDTLSHRRLWIGRDGSLMANQRILHLLRFSADLQSEEEALESAAGGIVPYELLKWYRMQLTVNAVEGLPQGWQACSRYRDGSPIPLPHRLAYRTRPALREDFPDPFAAGPVSLKAYLEGEAGLGRGGTE